MRRLQGALLGRAALGAVTAAVESAPPGGLERWERTNYAGRRVSLLGGLAQAAGTACGALLAGGRAGAAAAVAAATAGALGAVDDLTEREGDRHVKGLRGHLTALRRGQVTTGVLKIAGIGAGAVTASALLPATRHRRLADRAVGAALIAGSANLLNLFDLRPGRALKVTCAVAAPLALAGGQGAPVAAATLGAAASGLRDDLGERTMLGDTGANALGAALGTALAAHGSRWVRGGALGAIVGLTLLSERVSFSRVIDDTPVLRAVDQWGRR